MGKEFLETHGTNPKNNNNLLIVDGLNLAFRFHYANKKVFASDYINTVNSLAKSYQAKDVIVLGDGGSTYRENVYPEYKANRKEMRAKQTEQEAQDFKEFLEEFNKAFQMMSESFYTFRFRGVEADDIAAYIVKNYIDRYNHIWLISSDKDWDLLITNKSSRFSYVTRKEIGLENWNTHYAYNQDEHISIKVLMGDSGDNVPGVEGVGIKRAESLVKDYGSAYDIYAAIPINSKYKYIQNLNAFAEGILRNYELMDLLTFCDEAIGEENIKEIEEKLNAKIE
jgi:5'-3' exonuclease